MAKLTGISRGARQDTEEGDERQAGQEPAEPRPAGPLHRKDGCNNQRQERLANSMLILIALCCAVCVQLISNRQQPNAVKIQRAPPNLGSNQGRRSTTCATIGMEEQKRKWKEQTGRELVSRR